MVRIVLRFWKELDYEVKKGMLHLQHTLLIIEVFGGAFLKRLVGSRGKLYEPVPSALRASPHPVGSHPLVAVRKICR